LRTRRPAFSRSPGRLVWHVRYNAHVSEVMTAKVSQRGQTSLPAQLRHRWGIASGGDVAFIDLGDAALVVPGGIESAKAELRRALATGAYGRGLAAIDDPDLAV
jgi:bifunctional DNA-binding transcriptional regulator/antitoxin component of YhaV-PrlF toxin-antitoxin module